VGFKIDLKIDLWVPGLVLKVPWLPYK